MNAPSNATVAPRSTMTTEDYLVLKTAEGQTIIFEHPHECPCCHAMTAWFQCSIHGENRCWRCAGKERSNV